MLAARFRSTRIAEAPSDSWRRKNAVRLKCCLTSFAVMGIGLLEDKLTGTWAALISVPSFEQDDGPVLVAFMHTDEPQCAM